MMRPLAIFDIDGTLIDSRAVINNAMRAAFTGCGYAPPSYEQTRRIVGLSLKEAIDKLAPRDIGPNDLDTLVEAYKDAFVTAREAGDGHEPLYDGAMDVLDRLRGDGWAIGVATGKSRRGLDAIIESHNFAPYFDAHFCASDGAGKPDPFMVEANLFALDIPADQAVMIGDTSFDMIMGRRAEVATIGVDWGFHTANEIRAGGAGTIVSTMDALQNTLNTFAQTVKAAT